MNSYQLGLLCGMVKSAIIRQEGNEWLLYSHSGKVLGRHKNQEDAVKQEQAIQASKHGR